ncbi:MAG: D-alanyl-D-alanine carboxypeptidase family protein [Rhizomicrobium sp.]
MRDRFSGPKTLSCSCAAGIDEQAYDDRARVQGAERRPHKTDRQFPVSEAAWRTGGSKGFTRVGDSLAVEDLIQRIIVVSGNDACVVVAEALGGTTDNFVAMMNARARQLGLNQSHFVNPDGLPDPPGQAMSALDLAKLARHLIYDYPQYYHYFSVKSYTTMDQGKQITQPNRDLTLDKVQGADGLKTGHIDASGYGITASAKRDDRRIILVLNGLRYPEYNNDYFPNIKRSEEAGRIIDLAFREFRQYRLFKPGDTVGQAEVWGGTDTDRSHDRENSAGADIASRLACGHEGRRCL